MESILKKISNNVASDMREAEDRRFHDLMRRQIGLPPAPEPVTLTDEEMRALDEEIKYHQDKLKEYEKDNT